MVRAFLGGLSLASILFAPFWVAILFMGALAVRFCAWEVLFLGALIDLLYVPAGGIWHIPIPATLTFFLVLALFEPFRRKILV